MISEESISELLQLLERIGFPKERIEQELRKQIAFNIPEFSLDQTIAFGEEKMFFKLRFVQDFENSTIQLQECAASHRLPIPIEDVVINDVRTSELDAKMQAIDWKSYFADTITDDEIKENARAVLNDLWKLSFNGNEAGDAVQQKLVCKYFPETRWKEEVRQLSYSYWSFTRTINDFDDWNIHRSYMELSGKLDEIKDLLSKLNLNDIYVDEYNQLYRDIAAGKQEFDLKFSFNQPDGLSDISIPVRYSEDGYTIDTYTVQRTIYPAIEHGIYNNVDTKLLEEQMQQINWRDDNQLFIFKEDEEPELKPDVALVSEQLFHLSQDLVGADTADLLQLKYFIGVTFFDGNIPQTAWDTLNELPKRISSFITDTSVREAVNLVAGKPIMSENAATVSANSSTWMKYVFDEANEYYHSELIKGFPVYLLERQLRMLIPPAFVYEVKQRLLSGELTETNSFIGNRIFIQADPANKTLRVFDKNRKEIAVNFNLDADWQPNKNVVQYQRISTGQQIREIKPVNKNQKRKGPRL
ncbi:MAG TPA: hypothetical protein VGB84_04615 [Arachidicoccus sp.]